MFKFREFTSKDYDVLVSWLEANNEAIPSYDLLPPTTFVIEYNNKPLVIASVLLTNSKVAQLHDLIGDPNIKGPIRKEATAYMINECKAFCKSKEYKYLFGFTLHDKLKNKFEQLGCKPMSNKVYTLMLEL